MDGSKVIRVTPITQNQVSYPQIFYIWILPQIISQFLIYGVTQVP